MTNHPESTKERDEQFFEQAEDLAQAKVVQKLNVEIIDQVEAVLDASEILSAPKKTWVKKVQECESPDDFLKLFQESGIPGDKWKSSNWLGKKAKLSIEEGRVGQNLSGLYQALKKRFHEYPKFVAWMEGKAEAEQTWVKKVKECQSPDDFLRLFQEIGIPGDKWKNSNWLGKKAKLSIEDGGIEKDFSGLYDPIQKRFHSHPKFVAWMEGKTDLNKTWVEKVEECKTSEDFLKLFQKAGIPEDKWKSSSWLEVKAKLSIEDGGVAQNLSGLYQALKKRFHEYPKFVAWMEGKAKAEQTWVKKVKECQSPDDFLRLFQEIGIPRDKWKSSNWLTKRAKLFEEGRIGQNLVGLYGAIQKRFQGYPKFVAWMKGKVEPEQTWVEKVEKCQSPDDFLRLFQELKIPGNKWKNSEWLGRGSKLLPEEGGIGKPLAGLYFALKKRFEEYPKFMAWMEGKEVPKIHSPEEARELMEKEADRLNVSVDELLNPANITKHIKESPVLKEALGYFAKSKS